MEHPGELADRVLGLQPRPTARVARGERRDRESDRTPDERIRPPAQRAAVRAKRRQAHDHHRLHAGLRREHHATVDEPGEQHGDRQHERDLPPPAADDVHHEVAQADTDRDADRELRDAPDLPIHREAERDPGRHRREERVLVSEDVPPDRVGRPRGNRRLQHREQRRPDPPPALAQPRLAQHPRRATPEQVGGRAPDVAPAASGRAFSLCGLAHRRGG
ncbi:hypothetical protein GALL_428770 [mine drainage metagenome]|uniref:Uncharacterized protein n=1 Tax=mine drainage metagenome TaxID=410659 RepID=A0A1J5Q6F5_9ZZZZ